MENDEDAIEAFAESGRKRGLRLAIIVSIVMIAIGVTLAVVVLTAGDVTDYSFSGHAGRPYGNWTKLYALAGLIFVAGGVWFAAQASRLRRRT